MGAATARACPDRRMLMFSIAVRAEATLLATLLRGSRITSVLLGGAAVGVVLFVVPDTWVLPQALAAFPVRAPVASTIAAWLASLLLIAAMTEPVDAVDRTVNRPMGLIRAARVSLTTVLLALMLIVPAPQYASVIAVTLLTLTGECLLMARWAPLSTVWILPSAHVLAAMLFGARRIDGIAPWAWIIRSEPQPVEVAISVALFATGLTIWARTTISRVL